MLLLVDNSIFLTAKTARDTAKKKKCVVTAVVVLKSPQCAVPISISECPFAPNKIMKKSEKCGK